MRTIIKTNPNKPAIQRISRNFLPISTYLFAPFNWATIGVTEKITPQKRKKIVLDIIVPWPKPAKSNELALPAIIVSVVPINIYDIWVPKIGIPIFDKVFISSK